MPIPCPHFKITIVKRSQGQSAVAGAAYQSGERLFSEYDQKMKFYNKKKELVHAEIMLPSHAPPGFADRATLWNAEEAVENQWNSQLARRIVLAFPVEVPKEQYLPMLKEFCREQFVSKGMIADFAIHDKGDGNPHAHILLTLRAMDEHGKWLPKARKVYDLDENGERIQLPSGNWKCHKENTVDWNDQKYAEVWRHSWETITNRYLEAAGRPERVDLRSFERQGIQCLYSRKNTIRPFLLQDNAHFQSYCYIDQSFLAESSDLFLLKTFVHHTSYGCMVWFTNAIQANIRRETYTSQLMKGERCTIERPLFISSANFQLINICLHRIKKVRIHLHTLTSQQKIH